MTKVRKSWLFAVAALLLAAAATMPMTALANAFLDPVGQEVENAQELVDDFEIIVESEDSFWNEQQTVTSTRGVFAFGSVTGVGGYEIDGLLPREIEDLLHPVLEPLGFEWERRWIPRQEVLSPDGKPLSFHALFVDPQGSVTGTENSVSGSQTDSDVDLRRPWAAFSVNGGQCGSGFFNPTSYNDSTRGLGRGGLDDVWFEATCDRPSLPYDRYRVHFYEDPARPFNDDGSRSWGVFSQPYHGEFVGAGLVPSDMWQVGPLAVCGHRPSGNWDCYSTPSSNSGGWVAPVIENLTITRPLG